MAANSIQSYQDGAEETLNKMLSWKLGATSTSVSERKSVSLFPTTGNQYYPDGVRQIGFLISDHSSLLLPDTLTLRLRLKAKDNAQALVLKQGLNGLFNRLRISYASSLAEDITEYARTFALMIMLMPGYSDENYEITSGSVGTTVGAGTSMVLSMPLLSGTYAMNKAIPIKYSPLGIQLDLEPLYSNSADHPWEISDVQLLCDMIIPDSGVEEALNRHISSGKTIPLHCSTFFCSHQSFTGPDATVQVSRAVSRLQSCFVSFGKSGETNPCLYYKRPTGDYELQLQVGADRVPTNALKYDSERADMLFKTIGLYTDSSKVINISAAEFSQPSTAPAGTLKKHVCGFSFEKDRNSWGSGKSLRNGETLTVNLRSAADVNEVWVLYVHDLIVIVSDSSAEILA